MQVRSKETPESLVVKPSCVVERPGAEQGGSDWPVRSTCEACASVVKCHHLRVVKWVPSRFRDGEGHGTHLWLGAGVEGPTGVRGVERSDGCPGNWGDPPRPRRCGRREACRPITSSTGKGSAVERESEGVVVVTMGGTTQPVRSEGPLLHRCIDDKERDPDECRCDG